MQVLLLVVMVVGLLTEGLALKTEYLGKEMEKFEGTWNMVSLEVDGTLLPDQMVKEFNVKLSFFRTGEYTFTAANDTSDSGRFELDVCHRPTAIDFLATNEAGKLRRYRGIYLLDGDTLKMACTDGGDNNMRPREFRSDEKAGVRITVLKRLKP